MSSHTVIGRYILAYHPLAQIKEDGLEDALRQAERFNEDDKSGGRWAVHVLGDEVPSVPSREGVATPRKRGRSTQQAVT